MKKIISLLFIFLFIGANHLFSQSSWVKEYIDMSGCSAYFPSVPEWELNLAEDSSLVWIGEVADGDVYYGVICIEFTEYFPYDATSEDMAAVAESYLDYLRGEFKIVSHTGYVTGWYMDSNSEATGISDSWVDDIGDPWVIKTWIDPFNMAVMYIYGSPDSPITENQDFFFNSFRFPDYDLEGE